MKYRESLCAVTLGIFLALFARQARAQAAQPEPAPQVAIESFAPARAYAVGTETLTLVGTVRNVGKLPLPEHTVTARLCCLAGLDYTEGDTRPKLPALAPNASVTFHWRVQPTGDDVPLVAALVVDVPGRAPQAQVAAIQHFTDAPPGDALEVSKQPRARADGNDAVLENATVRAQITVSQAQVPSLLLSTHTATGWRRIGVGLPLAAVLSAEGGQKPWWEVFRSDEIHAENNKGEASLQLSGGFGLRWRATLVLTLRLDSSVLNARLLIGPLKPMKLFGVRCCPLLLGDGSFGAAVTEQIPPESDGVNSLAAVRWGVVTAGVLWPDAPILPGWQTTPLPNVEGADYRVLGVEMRCPGAPALLTQAALVQVRVRLFAFTPSQTVTDARRVLTPGKANPRPGTAGIRPPKADHGHE